MQRRYFVDTWLFIAHVDKHDSHHRQARRLRAALPDAALVTHEGVLSELLSYFAEGDSYVRTGAVAAVRDALRRMKVLTVDRTLFRRALDLYEARPEQQYSLTDCISMLVMRDRGITHVLTNDHHFAQERFTVLSDAP